jgi:uncharacterized protein HemX
MAETDAPKEKTETSALTTFVRGVVSTVESDAASKPKGKNSFPIALICAGIVAIIVAILGFMAVMARRKAALLQHELNIREEDHKRSLEKLALEHGAAEREKLVRDTFTLKKRVETLRTERESLEARRVDYEKALQPITSWDEIAVIRAPKE